MREGAGARLCKHLRIGDLSLALGVEIAKKSFQFLPGEPLALGHVVPLKNVADEFDLLLLGLLRPPPPCRVSIQNHRCHRHLCARFCAGDQKRSGLPWSTGNFFLQNAKVREFSKSTVLERERGVKRLYSKPAT